MEEKFKYISPDIARELIKRTENTPFTKSGGNSKAAIIDDYAVLKTGNIELRNLNCNVANGETPFDVVIDKLHQLYIQGVSVVPVLGYCYDDSLTSHYEDSSYGKGYIIQQKAAGQELWESSKLPSSYKPASENAKLIPEMLDRLHMLAAAPQEHFDKFVSDYKTITDNGIMIDPSKKSNFFYDPYQGFSFIDLNFHGKPLFSRTDAEGNTSHINFIRYNLLPCFSFLPCDESNFSTQQLDSFTKNNVRVYKKCVSALYKVGITEQELLDCLYKSNPESNYGPEIQIYGIKTPVDIVEVEHKKPTNEEPPAQ